jgi:hypothetical protein
VNGKRVEQVVWAYVVEVGPTPLSCIIHLPSPN